MKRRRRILAAFGGAMPLTLLIAACAPGDPASQPTAGPAAPLEAFYDQALSLEPCELPITGTDTLVAGECGYIDTPLDYDDAGGETVQVAVFRVAATGDSGGTILVNPGGPGFPGRAFAADLPLRPLISGARGGGSGLSILEPPSLTRFREHAFHCHSATSLAGIHGRKAPS